MEDLEEEEEAAAWITKTVKGSVERAVKRSLKITVVDLVTVASSDQDLTEVSKEQKSEEPRLTATTIDLVEED